MRAPEQLLEDVVGRFGRIDILSNNAGIDLVDGPQLEATTDVAWHDVLDTNVNGIMRVCRAAIPYLHEGASIVNMGSVNSPVVWPNNTGYSTSKGAVLMFSRALALELGPRNIRVNCVSHGIIETPLIESFLVRDECGDLRQECERYAALERMGKPEEVVNCVLFLASNESSYVTGSAMMVGGGASDPARPAVVGEEGHGIGDVARAAGSPQSTGAGLHRLDFRIIKVGFVGGGPYRPGSNGIDPDAERSEFEGHRFHEPHQPRLGRRIVRTSLQRHVGGVGRDAENRTRSPCGHTLDGMSAHVEGPSEVHVEDAVPRPGVKVQERNAPPYPGDRRQDGDLTEIFFDVGHRRPHRLEVPHVTLILLGRSSCLPDSSDRCCGVADVERADTETLRGETRRLGRPDAASRLRDKHNSGGHYFFLPRVVPDSSLLDSLLQARRPRDPPTRCPR